MENGVGNGVGHDEKGIEGTAFAVRPMEDGGGEEGGWAVKVGLAQMLKGGVIMDVVTPEQAKIAEEAGACAGSWNMMRRD